MSDTTDAAKPRRAHHTLAALGMAAMILAAPPMGQRIRSTGDADVDADLDKALAARDNHLRDEQRLADAEAKRRRKALKRLKLAARSSSGEQA